jgi:hypothetical protein
VDSRGGLNWWTYSAAGCTLDPAVAERVAVVTVARCSGGVNRLIVHVPYTDKAPWVGRLPTGSDPHVLTADERVTVLSGATLMLYTTSQGTDEKITAAPAGEVRDARLAGTGTPAAVADGDFMVVWTGRTAVGVDARNRTVLWSAPATGPPTLAAGQVVLAEPDGFTVRPASTGTPVTRVSAGSAVPAGAALGRIGRLVVAAGDGRLIAYG